MQLQTHSLPERDAYSNPAKFLHKDNSPLMSIEKSWPAKSVNTLFSPKIQWWRYAREWKGWLNFFSIPWPYFFSLKRPSVSICMHQSLFLHLWQA